MTPEVVPTGRGTVAAIGCWALLAAGCAGPAQAQTMSEGAAITAGTAVGAAAGKGVSAGIDKIFKKTADQTKAAAKGSGVPAPPPVKQPDPLLVVGPSVALPPRSSSGAAPSQPAASGSRSRSGASTAKAKSAASPAKPAEADDVVDPAWRNWSEKADDFVVPPPPPLRNSRSKPKRPQVAAAPAIPPRPQPQPVMDMPFRFRDLESVQLGDPRDAVLSLGDPSLRMTMFEDGHLLEVFRYRDARQLLGSVKLRDGVVASIELSPGAQLASN